MLTDIKYGHNSLFVINRTLEKQYYKYFFKIMLNTKMEGCKSITNIILYINEHTSKKK